MLSRRIPYAAPPPLQQQQQKKNSCLFSTKVLKLLLFFFSPSLPPVLSSLHLSLFLFDSITELRQLSSLLNRPQICISRFEGSPVHKVMHGQTTQAARLSPVLWWVPLINNRSHIHEQRSQNIQRFRTCHLNVKYWAVCDTHYEQYTFSNISVEGNKRCCSGNAT